MGKGAVRHRLVTHRLHRLHTGVYAVGHRSLTSRGRYLAAVLSCGPAAVLSHNSAAALWGLRPAASGRIHVTVPRGRAPVRRELVVHETRSLSRDQITRCEGIPITAVSRTLIDLAGTLRPRELTRALEQAEVLGLFDGVAVAAAVESANGRRGIGMLRRLLADLAHQPPPVRSEFERRFLELLHDARLPMPVVNGYVRGYEVDFHWARPRLIVETDGRATHDTAHAFERDRRRDLDLALAGWQVIRLSWRQLQRDADRIIATLRARLASAPR